MTTSSVKRISQVAGALTVLVGIGMFAGNTNAADVGAGTFQIITLANRADLVSEADILTEIAIPQGAAPAALKVTLNGHDVSDAFARRADGRVKGLLAGLNVGANTVRATLPGSAGARLTITRFPSTGPVISGTFPAAHYYCATPTPQPASADAPATNASGLTGQPDGSCNIPTEYKLYYKSTAPGCNMALPDPSPVVSPTATSAPPPAPQPVNPCFKPYDPSQARPADLATTTTDGGVIVPYIVRVERGVINRGIYDIAVLFDPTKPWAAVEPQTQWNRKLYYQFGGGSREPHRQFRPSQSWTFDNAPPSTFDTALRRGFLVAENSMSDSGTDPNRVLSAETVMMMKEHIVDTYGEILYAVATGGSGGAIDSHTTMSLTPNLIDGFIVFGSLMDNETVAMEMGDCDLLVEAYRKAPWLNLMATGNGGGAYSQAQINAMEAAINGHRDQTACQAWLNIMANGDGNWNPGNDFPRVVLPADYATGRITQMPAARNNCQLPASRVYDPVANRKGARCGVSDWSSGIIGKAADGIHPLEIRDNVGVQYGLRALLGGAISGEAFVTVNEIIGGFDEDSNLVATRTVADQTALRRAYQTGLIVNGASIAKYPEIDERAYDDSLIDKMPGALTTGVHQNWRSFSLRDRLDRDAQGHGSQVMWRYGRYGLIAPPALDADALTVMDTWLTAIKRDTSSDPIEVKVLRAKPADAVDYCLLSSDPTQSIKVTDQSVCDADPYLRPSASPRQVAGGPRTEDVIKCQLRPLNRADYGGRLSTSQFARLQAVFPTGVCDWNKPGVEQQAPTGSLMSFNGGPGGTPLGPPPASTP